MQDIANAPTMVAALDSSFSKFLELFPMFLPLAVFIGTLLTFYKLYLSSELVIMQSAGMSSYEIMRPMLWTSIIIGVITFTIINPLSTRYNSGDLKISQIDKIDNAIWVREKTDTGNLIIRSKNIKSNGKKDLIFVNGTIIKQSTDHKITERIDAKNIILDGSVITAKNARILDSKGLEHTGTWTTNTSLIPKNIIKQYLKPNQVSFWELPEFIRTLRKMDVPTEPHIMTFVSLLFLPFVLLSMTVLGVMFAQTHDRRRFSFSKKFGFGIITCFIVYFAMQIFNAMGSSGYIAPILAVSFPPAIVLFIASSIITRHNNI
jgi:lipopolysaccharide export system permease protein